MTKTLSTNSSITKIYYSLWDKNTGFLAEYRTKDEAINALHYYWNVYKKNINSGKWKKTRPFTYYIIKRDLNISPLHSEVLDYHPEDLFYENNDQDDLEKDEE